jgi:hypothetical protein
MFQQASAQFEEFIITRANTIDGHINILKYSELKCECRKESPSYKNLALLRDKELESFPEKIVAFYKDSLNIEFGKKPIEKSYLLNYQALLQDSKYQTAALANSYSTTYKHMDSISLMNTCAILLMPKNSTYLLEEDKKTKVNFDSSTSTNSSTIVDLNDSRNELIIEQPKWFDYPLSFWVKVSYNGSDKNSEWIVAPYGTQICDIDFEMSGRGNIKTSNAGWFAKLNNSNDKKVVQVLLTAHADGDNELLDRKSAKCIVKVKRVRLIPFYFDQNDRDRLECMSLEKLINLNNTTNRFDDYLQAPNFYITPAELYNLPDTYPIKL